MLQQIRPRDNWPLIAVIAGIACVLSAMLWGIINAYKHPCVKYGVPYQTWYQPPPIYTGTPGTPNYIPVQQPGYDVEQRDCLERKQ